MEVSLDVAALLAAIAWPVVLVMALLRYRGPIETFLTRQPVKSFSVAGILAMDFGEAKEMAPRWSGQDIMIDLRHPTPSVNVTDSTAMAFVEQLRENAPADYAVIDLGTGEEWLTSRLYILALLLQRMRGLKCFVFVETAQGTRRRYAGLAAADKVRWALASHFPWLEHAYSRAYCGVAPYFNIVSSEGKLAALGQPDDPYPAINLLQRFLQEIQAQAPASEPKEWVSISASGGSYGGVEHAQWLDAASLERFLGEALVSSYVRSADLHGKPNQEQVRLLLPQPARYVAVVREDGRFERLLDRQPLLEEVARNVLNEGSP